MTFMADSMPLGLFGKGSSSLCGLNSGQHLYVPVKDGSVVSYTSKKLTLCLILYLGILKTLCRYVSP